MKKEFYQKEQSKMQKHDLYKNAFYRTNSNLSNPLNPDDVKKLIFYGIKMINTQPKPEIINQFDIQVNLQIIKLIQSLISTLTPSEFETIFPIQKDFDGKKYECKDYFYTRDYLRTLPDEPIADVDSLLWEYWNLNTRVFTVRAMSYVDDMRRLEGQPSMMQEFAQANGIATYQKHTDSNGKEYMVGGGKSFRVRKPSHLKLVR